MRPVFGFFCQNILVDFWSFWRFFDTYDLSKFIPNSGHGFGASLSSRSSVVNPELQILLFPRTFKILRILKIQKTLQKTHPKKGGKKAQEGPGKSEQIRNRGGSPLGNERQRPRRTRITKTPHCARGAWRISFLDSFAKIFWLIFLASFKSNLSLFFHGFFDHYL